MIGDLLIMEVLDYDTFKLLFKTCEKSPSDESVFEIRATTNALSSVGSQT